MKILFITDLYPISEEEKSTPKTLLNFVKYFRQRGVKVQVLKPNFLLNSFLRGKPFYKTGEYDGVYNVNYLTPFLFDVKEKLTGSVDADIVVAHMPSGIIFANKLDLPMICAVHQSDIDVLTKPLYRIYFKGELEKAYAKAKGIACRSPRLKKEFLELFPQFKKKTFVASSGVEFEPCLRDLKYSKPLKVLTCAQLIKRKNIDKVIDALKGEKDFELTVIGDGKMRKNWSKKDFDVKFSGFLPREMVFEQMKKSDIFVLPSVGETLGMAYLEAMAAGCIVVATKGDGVDGIITNGVNGFLAEPTVSAIKKTLDKVKSLPAQARSKILKNAFDTIKQYSYAKCCEDYLQKVLKAL